MTTNKELHGKKVSELTDGEKMTVNALITRGLAGIDKKDQTVYIFEYA